MFHFVENDDTDRKLLLAPSNTYSNEDRGD